jgi:hypothetical protein
MTKPKKKAKQLKRNSPGKNYGTKMKELLEERESVKHKVAKKKMR